MMRYLLASFAIVHFTFSIAQSKVIRIGGLFTNALVDPLESGIDEVRAAGLAVQAINNDTSLLPNHTVRLIPRDDLGSGWGGLRALCNLTREPRREDNGCGLHVLQRLAACNIYVRVSIVLNNKTGAAKTI